MNIAAIAVAFNEDYQLLAFKNHYQQYCVQLYKHIIVDNGSKPDYVAHLRHEFPFSTILTLAKNDGTTAAFNYGIKYALEDSEVEGILLTVQDIELDPMFLVNLSSLLTSNPNIAAAGGVVFASGTQDRIESYGGSFDWINFVLHPHYNGIMGIKELPDQMEVDFIPGGVTLIRREAYEKVGLQDEKLFMYCDEVDWIFRIQKIGYKAVVTKKALAWHQHLNSYYPNQRLLRANFYTFRNSVYLIGKHYGRIKMIRYWTKSTLTISKQFFSRMIHKLSLDSLLFSQIIGLLYGVLGIMGRQMYVED